MLGLLALASSAQAFSEVQCAVKGGGGTGRPCCPSAAHSGWCCISSQGSLAQLSPLALTHCPDSVLALLSLLAPPTLFHMFPQVPVDGVSGNRASGRSPPFWAAASHVVEHRPVGSLAWGCLLSTQLQRAFRHLTDIHVTKRCHRGRQRAQVCLKVSALPTETSSRPRRAPPSCTACSSDITVLQFMDGCLSSCRFILKV